MARRWLRLHSPADGAARLGSGELQRVFDDIRAEFGVPAGFPPQVLQRADWAARHLDLPDRDETDVPFFTIDPPGSMDLDQAVHLAADGEGYRVRYAIADLPAAVRAGDEVDVESWGRGQTIYAPDRRTPLHPPAISEDAASLLPGQVRSAYVWDLRLDGSGEVVSTDLYRARVRSVERLSYAQVQEAVDAAADDERFALLRAVGSARLRLEAERGGASLPMPEQEIVPEGDGRYRLVFRPPVPAEEWNAQISLMTGMAAARLMLDAGVGLLRTMPPADANAVGRLRRQARGLGALDWPEDLAYGRMLRSLDRRNPRHLALIHESAALFRGAGYTAFDGDAPAQQAHAAVAAPYAHVTAPLRRLVDRFGLAVCLAVRAGEAVPDWVREALPRLPEVMQRSDAIASSVQRACTDAVEAADLRDRVGEVMSAYVVDVRRASLLVQVADPAILAPAVGHAQAGWRVKVRLVEADVAGRTVRFEVARGAASGDA